MDSDVLLRGGLFPRILQQEALMGCSWWPLLSAHSEARTGIAAPQCSRHLNRYTVPNCSKLGHS